MGEEKDGWWEEGLRLKAGRQPLDNGLNWSVMLQDGGGVDRGPPVGFHSKVGEELVCRGQDGSCSVSLWWEEERCH